MNFLADIIDLETRAQKAGLSVAKLCALAKVDRSTLTRWKNKSTSPNISTLLKLEGVIASYNNQPTTTKPKR